MRRVCGREQCSQVMGWGEEEEMCGQSMLGAGTLNIALITEFVRSWNREKGRKKTGKIRGKKK